MPTLSNPMPYVLDGYAYRRDINIVVRRSCAHRERLTATLVTNDYRDEVLIGTYVHECETADSIHSVRRHFASQFSRVVKVCEIDQSRPSDPRIVPISITWDILIDKQGLGDTTP
jgi:hypothetical protein